MTPAPEQSRKLSATPVTPSLEDAITTIPTGMYQVSVYTTDDQKVVSIYGEGKTYDLRIAKPNKVKKWL